MPPVISQAPTRPYRDFVTPVLHKRFTNAAAYTLLLCWLIAIWQGTWHHYLWSWLPIGPVGVRALLLFISALIVYVLRLAQYHIGERNTENGADTFRKYALRSATVRTVGCYMLSAWLYGEIFIWSQPPENKLSYTDQGKNYERLRLNERPMFLRYMFVILALVQSALHLWTDKDRIDFPAVKVHNEQDPAATTSSPSPHQTLLSKLSSMATAAAIWSVGVNIVGTIFYYIIRYTLWAYYYSFARNFVSLSKSRPLPVTLPPFASLAAMSVIQGALLLFLWQFISTTFNVYMSQAPLKNGKPITNDSKDQNGSLLNGLRGKKATIKAAAHWELALITDSFPERRKTIYREHNRKKGATLKQVVDICLSEVTFLIERLKRGIDPDYRPKEEFEKKSESQETQTIPTNALLLKDGNIKGPGHRPTTTREKFGDLTADFAKSLSSPQNNLKTRELLKKGVTEGSEYLKKGVQGAEPKYSSFIEKFIASPFGYPFRHSLRRTASVIVGGIPYSRLSILCNAITALTNLVLVSFKEDEFQLLPDEIPRIVRVFTEALQKLDEYIAKLDVHWSDVDTLAKPEAQRKKVEEVELVRECLRMGLERIVRVYGEYFAGMGLERAEVVEAKRVAANGPEMAVVR